MTSEINSVDSAINPAHTFNMPAANTLTGVVVGLIMAPVVTYATYVFNLTAKATENVNETVSEVIKLGLGGLIVYLVTKPLLNFAIKRAETAGKAQAELIQSLKQTIQTKEERDEMMRALSAISRAVETHNRAAEALLHEVKKLKEKKS